MMMLHKFNRRLLNGGLLAAIVVAGLTGCSGSGGDNIPRRDTVPLTGGAESQAVTLDNAAPADANGQTITFNGGSSAFLAPTNAPLTAGSTVVIVPEGTQFFSGLTRSPSRSPGDIFVNGVDSGVNVDQNGELDGNIAIVNGFNYEVFVEGPLQIQGNGKQLDINDGFGFNVIVRGNVASLPAGIEGTIPSNGGTAADMFLSVAYPQPFTDDTITLEVLKSNGDVSQSRTLSAVTEDGMTMGFSTFRDFVPSVVVPAEGVERINLRFHEN